MKWASAVRCWRFAALRKRSSSPALPRSMPSRNTTRPRSWPPCRKTVSARSALRPPPAMAIMISAVKRWKKSMPIPSTPKPHWFARRSPAAPMRWRWRWPPISAPAMSFTLRSAVPTILSRKSSASAPARAHWPSSASPTGRPNCCRMAPSIMKISVNQSTKKPSWSPSSAPRAMPPAPPSRSSRSAS